MLWLSLPLTISGCALPFASPPVQLQGGMSLRRMEGSARPPSEITYPGQLKVGVHPLQLLRGWARRPVDAGVGYVGDFDGTQSIHGAYADVAPTLLTSRRGRIKRLSLHGQARLLHAVGYPGVGYGGALQVSGEIGGFVPGTIDWRPTYTSGATGYGWGESTIGLYAEMAYAQIDTLRVFTMTGGLQWRLPATIGALFTLLGDEKKGRQAEAERMEAERREAERREAETRKPGETGEGAPP